MIKGTIGKFLHLLIVPFLLAAISCNAATTKQARAVLIVDRNSGKVIEELNARQIMPIASITKLMTVYTVLESGADLLQKVTIGKEPIEGSHVLRPGMQVSRYNLLVLSLVASDNLAAKTLATSHPSGYANFIVEMNANARALGMINTLYIEPTGLLLNTSTAWDLYALNRALQKYSIFKEAAMFKTAEAEAETNKGKVKKVVFYNTNTFAGTYDIKVGKTGFTNPAGWCISMSIELPNRVITDIIVLGSPSKSARNFLVSQKLKQLLAE